MVLTATYFDTPEHALSSSGATLRRRTGGGDDGWHLKLSVADGERLEVHRPIGRAKTPPAALTTLVRAFVGSRELGAVATLTTRRTVHQLLDSDGRALAELADDTVTGERLDRDLPVVRWREVEIELLEGDRELMANLAAVMLAGGVAPAGSASKVGRVLQAPDKARHRRLRRSAGRSPPAKSSTTGFGTRHTRCSRPTPCCASTGRAPRPGCVQPCAGCELR